MTPEWVEFLEPVIPKWIGRKRFRVDKNGNVTQLYPHIPATPKGEQNDPTGLVKPDETDYAEYGHYGMYL